VEIVKRVMGNVGIGYFRNEEADQWDLSLRDFLHERLEYSILKGAISLKYDELNEGFFAEIARRLERIDWERGNGSLACGEDRH
jgi:hypothetical protein